MQKYAKDMCELQKQECANNTEAKARWCSDNEIDEKKYFKL